MGWLGWGDWRYYGSEERRRRGNRPLDLVVAVLVLVLEELAVVGPCTVVAAEEAALVALTVFVTGMAAVVCIEPAVAADEHSVEGVGTVQAVDIGSASKLAAADSELA